MKKLILLIALLAVILTLFSCKGADKPAVTTPAPAPADVAIYKDGKTEYKIVRGQRSSDGVKDIVVELRSALNQTFGSAPYLSDDWVKDESTLSEDAPEILIGDTNRPDSIALKEALPAGNSYAIAVKGSRVVIVAANEAVLAKAVDVFIHDYVQKNAQGGNLMLKADLFVTDTLTDFVREGWQFHCPAPQTGSLAEGVYYSGSGLADDIRKETDECSRMHLLTDMTVDDFNAYVAQMKKAGYTQTLDNTIGRNQYAGFAKGNRNYYVSYTYSSKEMRVSEDRAGVSLDEFAYTAKGDLQTVIYQYGLYYDPNNNVTNKTVNCGMLYIVRLSDNSLVIVDGGHLHQATQEMMDGLVSFLHEVTGTKAGEKFKVAAWYMTHAHGDHVTVFAKLCNRYHDEMDLQRVMYNIPSYQVRSAGYDENTTTAKAMIRKYYPDVKFLKLHTGQTFHLADMGVEVLYTHEDAVGVTQFDNAAKSGEGVKFDFSDYNSSSSVVRFHIDGKSVILLGDISTEAEKVIAKNFSAAELKSDAVQAAHHCFNYLNTLYPMIASPIVMMPNSYYACHRSENYPKLQTLLKYADEENVYYEGTATYGFAVVDGEFTKIYEAPIIGGEYDNSGI